MCGVAIIFPDEVGQRAAAQLSGDWSGRGDERVSQRGSHATLKSILTVRDRSNGFNSPRGGRYFIYRPPRAPDGRCETQSAPCPSRRHQWQPRRADPRRRRSRLPSRR